MSEPQSIMRRLSAFGRREIAEELSRLCDAVGAEESSLLVPSGSGELVFFTSTNPALAGGAAPPVPVEASFTGLAFCTGQTIAVADAAHQPGHFDRIDAVVDRPTREFAAIPVPDARSGILAVLTLANRRAAPFPRAGQPFSPAELAEAAGKARDLGRSVAVLIGLDREVAGNLDLAAELTALGPRERRVVRAVMAALGEGGGSRDGDD